MVARTGATGVCANLVANGEHVSFSPWRDVVLTASSREVKLRSARTREILESFSLAADWNFVTLSPRGDLASFLFLCSRPRVEIRAIAGGALLRTLTFPADSDPPLDTFGYALLSPRQDLVVANIARPGKGQNAYVWSLQDGQLLRKFGPLCRARLTSTGDLCAQDLSFEHLRTYSVLDGALRREAPIGGAIAASSVDMDRVVVDTAEACVVRSTETGRDLLTAPVSKDNRGTTLSAEGDRFAVRRSTDAGRIDIWEIPPESARSEGRLRRGTRGRSVRRDETVRTRDSERQASPLTSE